MASLTGSSPTLTAFADSSPALRLDFQTLVGRLLVDDDVEVRASAGLLVARTLGDRPTGLAHEQAVRHWDELTAQLCASLPEYRVALWTSLAVELETGRLCTFLLLVPLSHKHSKLLSVHSPG
jgi:hypothetical protein